MSSLTGPDAQQQPRAGFRVLDGFQGGHGVGGEGYRLGRGEG